MNNDNKEIIQGAKGGDKQRTPVEATDSLRSKQIASIVDVVAEGEIVGLVDGMKSIFLNETPLQNADGTFNFKDVSIEARTGTVDQKEITGFSDTEFEVSVSSIVLAATPVVRTINNSEVDAVRLTIGIPQLTKQDKETGDISGTSLDIRVEVQNNGGGYRIALTDRVYGKTTSKFQKQYVIELDGDGPWDIRVSRLTPDAPNLAIADAFYWESYTGILHTRLSYPNSALVAIHIDSANFSSIPTRSYDIKGRIIKIPSNYNPATRAYNGIWDGTFQMGWTDNPAWCFLDMVTQERFGLGRFIDIEAFDKWSLYSIARYCDALVYDGRGGVEPRFTCNLYLQTQEDALRVLQNMASIFRAITFWGGGTIITSQDSPSDAVAQYTNANVVDGEFNYSGTSLKQRHTVALVSWNDPNDFFRQKVEYVQDDPDIARFGIIETQVNAFGCTSQGQAHRFGKWLLTTERYTDETVNFKTGIDGCNLYPGAVFQTTDLIRAGTRLGGRLLEVSAGIEQHILVLDAPVLMTAGHTYQISVQLPDGKLETRDINGGDGEIQNVVAAGFSLTPQVGAVWVITDVSTLVPELWRVLSVAPSDENDTVDITALRYTPGLYELVENDIVIDELPTSGINTKPDAPTGLTTLVSQYRVDGAIAGLRLMVSWESGVGRYRVEWRKADGMWNRAEMKETSFELESVDPVIYEFKVVAISVTGRDSAVATTQTNVALSAGDAIDILQAIANLSLEVPYVDSVARFMWDRVKTAVSYEVQVGQTAGIFVPARTYNVGDVQRFAYSPEQMKADGGPWRGLTIRVRPVGAYGKVGPWAVLNATNPQVAALSNIKLSPGINTMFFSCDAPNSTDTAGIMVWMSTDPNFVPSDATLCYEGPSTYTQFSAFKNGEELRTDVTYYLRAAAYDTLGKDALSYSDNIETRVFPSLFSVGGSLTRDLETSGWFPEVTDVQNFLITDGPSGDSVRRSAVDAHSRLEHSDYITIDRTHTYRTKFWARAAAGTNGLMYHGLRQYLPDGNTGPDNGGRLPYKPMEVAPHSDWREYSFDWSADDWQVGVTKVRPSFLLNYRPDSTPITGYWEIQSYSLHDVTGIVAALAAADAAGDVAVAAGAAAAAANLVLSNIASDSMLTPGEKPAVVQSYSVITQEKGGILAQAAAFGVTITKAQYEARVTALTSYLATLTGWDVIPGPDVAIVGSTFRAMFADVYTARQALLADIAAVAATRANWENVDGADAVNAAIQNAQNAAVDAQNTANAANAQLQSIASDSILSRGEKPAVILNWEAVYAESSTILTQAANFTVSVADYSIAYSNLATYLGGLVPQWSDTTVDTPINPAVFRGTWAAYYFAKVNLLNAIAAEAATTANWATGIEGRPDDSALLNSAIRLGGRNFFLNSQYFLEQANNTGTGTPAMQSDESTPYYRITAPSGVVSTYCATYVFPKIAVGTVCTLSADVRTTAAIQVGFYNAIGMQEVPANKWTRIFYTFTYDPASRNTAPTGFTAQAGQLDVRNYKMEIGNIGTDWSPAPEDIDALIAEAQAAATAAQDSANSGAADAADALLKLTNIASDSILSPGEKPAAVEKWNVILSEHMGIYNQGTTYNLIPARDAFYATVSALDAYLSNLQGWNTVPGSDVAITSAFRTNFENYYVAKQTLLNAIAVESGRRAVWATGLAGRPEDHELLNSAIAKGDFINRDPNFEHADQWSVQSNGSGSSSAGFAYVTNAPGAGSKYCIFPENLTDAVDVAVWVLDTKMYPIDPARAYELAGKIYTDSGNERYYYLGVCFYTSDGTVIQNSGWGGSWTGYPSYGVPAPGQFTRYAGWFGTGTQYSIPPNATQCRVGVILNYGGGAVGKRMAAQELKLVDVTEAQAIRGLVTTAQNAANAAAAQATTANAQLQSIASDSILSRGEKSRVIQDWNAVLGEDDLIVNQAQTLGVSHADYDIVTTRLMQYLGTLSPLWNDTTQDTPIVATDYRAAWSNYYKSKVAILNAIAAKAATKADWINGLKDRPTDAQLLNNRDYVIENPGGGIRTQQASVEYGAIKILLPVGWSDTMLKFTVDIYEYLAGYSCTMEISGYNYHLQTWVNVTAKVAGFGSNVEYPVYFGYDSVAGKCAVWIGNHATEEWSYPQIRVKDVFLGYNAFSKEMWENGWNISISQAAPTHVSQQVLDTLPGADWAKVKGATAVNNSIVSAQNTANAAVAESAVANAAIAAISSDNVISKAEKPDLILRWGSITGEVDDIIDKADKVLVDRAEYFTKYIALNNYLPVGWNDISIDTAVDGATLRARFLAYYNARQALLNAIALKASKTANWVDGLSGRPTDAQLLNNRDSVITNPGGGLRLSSTASETGSIKITLPVSWTNTMLKLVVDIYEYVGGYSCTLEIAGYNYAPTAEWAAVTARVSGANSNVEYPVHFGHDGTRCCVWIGEVWSEWVYPQIRIKEVFLGYSGVTKDLWENGWEISISPIGPQNLTASVVDTLPGADWSKVKGAGAVNSAIVAAQNAANSAAAAAAAAQSDADLAETALNGIVNDNILARSEKSVTIKEWETTTSEVTKIEIQASNLGASYSVLSEAHNALASYLVSLSPYWSDLTQDTPIHGPTYRSYWVAYNGAKVAVLNAIAAKAAEKALWSNIAGQANAPANNATVGATKDNLFVTLPGDNLCLNSGFERYSGVLAEGFNIYNNAEGNEPTVSSLVNGRIGGLSQAVTWTGNHYQTKGIYGPVCHGGWQAHKTYVVSFYACTAGMNEYGVPFLAWNVPPAWTETISGPPITGSWQRYAFRITWGASVEANGVCFFSAAYGSGGGDIRFDDMMVTEGDVLAAYYPSTIDAQSTADAAKASAATANSQAAIANALISSITSDNVLTDAEKPALIQAWNVIVGELQSVYNQGTNYGLIALRNAYDAAYYGVGNYLATIEPHWYTIPGQSVGIDGTVLRARFATYYVAKQSLLNGIVDSARVRAGDAQSTANAAVSNAAAAQNTANAAAANAATANAALAVIASDGWLSKGEKPAVIKDWEDVYAEAGLIPGQASVLGVSSADYSTAYIALSNYLGGLSPHWGDTTQDTPIVAATFRAAWYAYNEQKVRLLNAIAAKAATMATGVTLSPTGALSGGGTSGQLTTVPVVDGGGERYVNRPPTWYPVGTIREFKQSSEIGLPPGDYWCTLETIKQYTENATGFPGYQYAYQGTKTYRRQASSDAGTSWTAWVQDLDRNAYTGDLDATKGTSLVPDLFDPAWTYNTSDAVETVSTDAPAGPKVRRSLAGREQTIHFSRFLPLNRTRKYRTRFWARAAAGTNGVLYHALQQLMPDGNGGPYNSGLSPYLPGGVSPHTNWVEYNYEWTAAHWQPGVTQLRPYIILNYQGSAGYWEIQDYVWSDITEAYDAKAAADSAAVNASAAANAANAANSALAIIASDAWLSRGEKPAVIKEWETIYFENGELVAKASLAGVSSGYFSQRRSELDAYLNSLSPAWSDPSVDTQINTTAFRTAFHNFYLARTELLNLIAADARTKATDVRLSTLGVLSGGGTSGQITSLVTLDLGDGGHFGARNRSDFPIEYPAGTSKQFKTLSAFPGLPQIDSYFTLETVKQYVNSSGGGVYQYAYIRDKTYRRWSGNADGSVEGTWSSWVIDLDRNSYTGDLNASSDIKLVGRGVTINGNTAVKTGGIGNYWDADCYSQDRFVGGAYASAVVTTLQYVMFGLNSDPTSDAYYASLDYAFEIQAGGGLACYEYGNLFNPSSTVCAIGDVLAVVFDGSTVRYIKNGTVIRTVYVTITDPLFFDSSFYSTGATLSNIRFGPMTSNNWAAIGGINKPSDNASSDIKLGVRNLQLNGNSITKLAGGNAWDADCFSHDSFANGAYVSVLVPQSGGQLMFGLNADPYTDSSYSSLDYAIYLAGSDIYVYESNVPSLILGTYSAGDMFTVTYDNATVVYRKNGVFLKSTLSTPGRVLHFDSSILTQGHQLTNIRFGPHSPNDWASVKGPGRPQDNATDGAVAGVNLKDNNGTVLVDAAIKNFHTEGGMGHLVRPSGGTLTGFYSNAGGALAIYLPAARYASSTMLRIRVEIYEYATGAACTYILSGYNDVSALWYHPSASYDGPVSGRKKVRFGRGGGREVIYIGETTSVWQYPQVKITEVTTGYSGYDASLWASGWLLQLDGGFGSIEHTIETPGVGGALARIDAITPANSGAVIGSGAIYDTQLADAVFSVAITGTLDGGKPNTTSAVSCGTLTAVVTGGRAPFAYSWVAVTDGTDPDGATGLLSVSVSDSSVTGVGAKVSASNTGVGGYFLVTVTDALKRTAIAKRDVYIQFGVAQ